MVYGAHALPFKLYSIDNDDNEAAGVKVTVAPAFLASKVRAVISGSGSISPLRVIAGRLYSLPVGLTKQGVVSPARIVSNAPVTVKPLTGVCA